LKKARALRLKQWLLRICAGQEDWQDAVWTSERQFPTRFSKPEIQISPITHSIRPLTRSRSPFPRRKQSDYQSKIGKAMNESEYYAGEFNDSDLDSLADTGEFYLNESAFFFMPTQKEMQQLAEMGNALLVVDWFRTL
jgi:hypothetical protein